MLASRRALVAASRSFLAPNRGSLLATHAAAPFSSSSPVAAAATTSASSSSYNGASSRSSMPEQDFSAPPAPTIRTVKAVPSSSSSSSSSYSSSSPSSTTSSAARTTPAPSPSRARYASSAIPASAQQPPVYRLDKVTNRIKLPDAADAPSPEATPPPAGVNWADSFHGVATRPVTEEQFQVLMQPVAEQDVEVKPDGIIYLPEIKYRRRLNEAFGPMGWGLIPKSEPVVAETIVTREYALVINGRFVSQAQGENSFFGRDQLPSSIEGCKSNALMRCCKDLGIASELWDPLFIRWFRKNRMEEVWVEHSTTKKRRTFWYRKGAVDVAYPYKQVGK